MIRITNLSTPIDDCRQITTIAAERLNIDENAILGATVVKKGIDARRYKGAPILFVYTVDIHLSDENESAVLKRTRRDKNIFAAPEKKFDAPLPQIKKPPTKPPVVIGFGPAGMFAGLTLARANLCPVILERGAEADERQKKVRRFWQGGELDENSNVQFGEGGAGTFSDGKLTARSGGEFAKEVIDTFLRHGAPPEIAFAAKPHIGTDRLIDVVKNIRREIISLGGKVLFNAKASDFIIDNNKVNAVIINGEERIDGDAFFLAIGHSARDTYEKLHEKKIRLEGKAFAVGMRIEHPQEMIDRARYGEDADNPLLPAADYLLTYKDSTKRGVYTFCMCPGGFVVAATSEQGGVVTNGMSNHARNSGVANAAILVQVSPDDFPAADVLAGMRFQRDCEQRAFAVAGGDYAAPVMSVGDFLRGVSGSTDFLVPPTYAPAVKAVDFTECLPNFVLDPIRRAIPFFARQINGFDAPDIPLTGVEMRSSAPIRIVRQKDTFVSESTAALYPIGEGAGYAGGIVSSAADGIKAAQCYIRHLAGKNTRYTRER